MTGSYADVWQVPERGFPHDGPARDRLRYAVRYGILAPSGHNAQPWRFRIGADVLEVRADRARALPTIDPDGRELVIACAAALHHIRVALAHFGHRPRVRILPEPADNDLLATVRIDGVAPPPLPDPLFAAITARHCNRGAYQPLPLTPDEIGRLDDAAHGEGARLVAVTDRTVKASIAAMVAAGDRIKWRDKAFRNELAERLLPNRGRRRDGMPGYAFGLPGPAARLAPALVRRFDFGSLRARTDRAAATASAALVVIVTDVDDAAAWMAAGQAMSNVLLRATAEGLATAFLSQPIEVAPLRVRLADTVGGHPQIMLRVGRPRHPSHVAPRRPLDEVLE